MILEAGKIYQCEGMWKYPYAILTVYSNEIYHLHKYDTFFVVKVKEKTNNPNYISSEILTDDGTICCLEVNEKWNKESLWYFEEVK